MENVRLFLAAVEDDATRNVRDAAILALGFAGAFRRSELSAQNIEDLGRTGLFLGLPKRGRLPHLGLTPFMEETLQESS